MEDIKNFPFEGREISYTFRQAESETAPLLVLLHGHVITPRPSKFRDSRWNILCPVDNFGVEGAGSWYLGEGGDLFWLRAMPALIAHVYSGKKLFFAGSSMGGYGAILHGSLNRAYGVYANVAQTLLLGSTYSESGMKKYFNPIFEPGKIHEYSDLKNIITRRMPTTFIISGYRFDKVNYLEEQTFPFIQKLMESGVNFSHELRLGKGHALTHSIVEISDIFLKGFDNIEENFERLSSNDSSLIPATPSFTTPPGSRYEAGKILVEHGQWYLEKYGTAQIGVPINWEMDPFKNRSWVWLLHQFDFFKDLIAYERKNGGRKGYDFCLKAAFSWWAEFSNKSNSPAFAWHDHGSANRANNMLYLRDSLRESGIRTSERTDRFFSEFFTAHASFLADETEYSSGTNHGLDQSLSLFSLASENRSLPWSKEYLSLALSRLNFELQRNFESDGGHKENSINYQEFGIRQIIKSLKMFRKYKTLDSDRMEKLRKQLEKSSLALSYMIAPNSRFPLIGDTEYLEYPNILASFSNLSTFDNYLYANSAGKQGTPPTAPDLILPKSGWAALRSGWKDESDLHLLTKCAFNSHYHRHDDDTSFVLHAFGEEWITDGGLYKYEEKDPMRIHLRSHYAHSLSAPDGVDPVRNVKTHGGRNRIEDSHTGSDIAWVQMISHMFPGYVSQRRITLERPNLAISISDRLAPLDGAAASASCTTRFLVPQNKTVKIEGANIRIEGGNSSLLISPDRKPDHIAVISGQTEPELRGWQSRTFNTIDPAHSIELHYTGGELDVTYHLCFG